MQKIMYEALSTARYCAILFFFAHFCFRTKVITAMASGQVVAVENSYSFSRDKYPLSIL